MRSRILLPIVLALGALAASAGPAAAVEVGVNQTLNQTRNTADTASALRSEWVRIWGGWDAVEPGQDRYAANIVHDMNVEVNALKAKGLKVLVVMQRTPPWASGTSDPFQPPVDPADFGSMMGYVAKHVPGVDAWELWNEPDSDTWFRGGEQPARFAAMLKSAYPAIKAVQPGDVVVTGGTTGNNMDFIEALYQHGLKGNFDAIGVHTDTVCLTDGPDYSYRDPQGRIGRYTFSSFREVYEVMQAHGDGDKKIWMTELGWSTQSTDPTSCPYGAKKGLKAVGVTENEQAAFLTAAYQCLRADPTIGVAFWYGLQDFDGHSHAGGYGLYRRNGSAKPAAQAFKALADRIQARRCGGVIDTAGPQFTVKAPQDGLVFRKEMGIDVEATDAGGVGIKGTELRIDGKFYRYFGDGHATMPILWESREWRNGTSHKLTFIAEDNAGNEATMSVTVKKVRRLPKARTVATVSVTPVDATSVRVTGGVSTTKAQTARVTGKAFLVFDRLEGTRWKRMHKVRKGAGRGVDVIKALAPGHWRVKLVYKGKKRFKKSVSAPVEFDVAPAPAA
ncbi:MAG TPA: hypothetical protein VD836_12345 [Solirubrobacteraceae bacterium]|nr:hypothetical protein [Solirubrobacteraceae bacterium]